MTTSSTTSNETVQQQQPKPKFKLSLVGSSPDGDRIFCMYKFANKLLVRGYYDFLQSAFILLCFQPNNLQEGQTAEQVLRQFAHDLMDEFDWEFKDVDKIIGLIKNGKTINKKRKRKEGKGKKANKRKP